MLSAFKRESKSLIAKSVVVGHRFSSGYIDINDDLDHWPKSKVNYLLNVCPQGNQMVVERLGKLSDVKEGGYFFAIPFIDYIRYTVDMREKALSIHPQSCITKDNVHVLVSGTLYCQFVDAKQAAYGSKNPIYAVKQHAQSSMRAAIGEAILFEISCMVTLLETLLICHHLAFFLAWGLYTFCIEFIFCYYLNQS
jgi:SPFH domain / Band 7 family